MTKAPKTTTGKLIAKAKRNKSKGGGAKASSPSASATASMRRRIQELEQDKRLLRSALDRACKLLKSKGVDFNG